MKIGVMGGGQLGQMLALAAYPLGIQVLCYETNPDCPAGLVTEIMTGAYEDQEKLLAFAEQVDVITYEFENIPITALQHIAANCTCPIYPPLPALAIGQDRLAEKSFFTQVHVPTTKYIPADSLHELEAAVTEIGFPAVIKTRRLGYDGKGQCLVRAKPDIELAWTKLQGQALIVENFIAFEREVSCIAVRSISGETVCYSLTANQHQDGILRVSAALSLTDDMTQVAQNYLQTILTALNYVGVLTVEFFQQAGHLIANEMAPRVHNSGHWTIEGAQTSQFENHIRAITGLPLGSTTSYGQAAMVNFIGQIPDSATVLKIPAAHYHTYGKQPRPGRKLGHATLCTTDAESYAGELKKLILLAAP